MVEKREKKKPYDQRSDIERLLSNWTKVRGLLKREEWSAAILRAATTCEIAANLAIRRELIEKRGLEKPFVDTLMIWANGLAGKVSRLLTKVPMEGAQAARIRVLEVTAGRINARRNQIVHAGNFMNEQEARETVSECFEFVRELLDVYEPAALSEFRPPPNQPSH